MPQIDFYRFLIWAFLALLPMRAYADDPLSAFTHRTWHVQEGLPDQVVQALAQTRDGYLWVGTTKGLLRFDGSTFVPFTGVAALRHGVTCLMVAHDGSLYIGTEGGGLLLLHDGHMQRIGEGIANMLIRALLQEQDGTIWVGTDSGIYRATGDHFQRMEPVDTFPNLGVAALVQDREGAIWSGGSRLLRFQRGRIEERTLPRQNGSMRVKAMSLGSDGRVWVGAVAGLFHQLPDDSFEKINAVQGSVRTLVRLPSGELWAGSAGDGLYVQHGDAFDQVRAPRVLPSNTILSQFTDRDGNLWLGTQGGLLRLSRTGMRLTALPDAQDSDFGTLMRDADGSLWICSSQLFHMTAGVPKSYTFPNLPEITIRTMLRERDGALWLGTTGRGAYRIEPNGHIAHFTSEIGTNYIRGFLQAPDGSVWIGSDGGVARFHDGVVDSYHQITHAPRTLTLAMAEDHARRLWIGTQRGLATLKDGSFEDLAVTRQFRDQAVWTLLANPDGTLWIGADTGLYRLRDGKLSHIDLGGDAPSPAVYQVLQDAGGFSWIAGPTRVFRIPTSALNHAADDPSVSLTPEVFSVSAEIESAELYGGMQSPGVLDTNGSAWFATSQGPLRLVPHEQPTVGQVPLRIERMLIDGRSVPLRDTLTLPAGTRTLQIDFAPVMLSSQSSLRFRQRLQNFSDWSSLSSSRSAVYTNLPAGKYTFTVEAVQGNSGRIASLQLPVSQRAFFYRTSWFYALCLLLAIAIVRAIYQFRVHQIRKDFRTISIERNRLAREMHDTVIQGCTAVSALLEAHDISQPEGSSATLLSHARDQIRTTIDEARHTVWNLRHEVQGHRLAPNLQKLLLQCVRSTKATSSFEAEGREPLLDAAIAHELLMTTREALSNAAVHSNATQIDLRLRCSTSELKITVSDNGSGFDPEQAAMRSDHHYGLRGMRERIEGLGGTFSLLTANGKGTCLTFVVPRAALRSH